MLAGSVLQSALRGFLIRKIRGCCVGCHGCRIAVSSVSVCLGRERRK